MMIFHTGNEKTLDGTLWRIPNKPSSVLLFLCLAAKRAFQLDLAQRGVVRKIPSEFMPFFKFFRSVRLSRRVLSVSNCTSPVQIRVLSPFSRHIARKDKYR